MSTKSEPFTFGTEYSGEIGAVATRPDPPPPWPALIIVHGINGVGPHIEAKAADFAAEGYLAVVPDIYTNDAGFRTLSGADILEAAHMGVDPERQKQFLAALPESRRVQLLRAREWASNRQGTAYIDIVRGCFNHLAARGDIGAIGAIGYCMGGRLVGELAVTGAALAAGVIYYGAPPPLDLVANIRCPLQGHYAVTDHRITGKVPAFAAALKAAGKEFTSYVYEAGHGFSLTPGTRAYDEAATALSLTRIKPFLASNLKARVLTR